MLGTLSASVVFQPIFTGIAILMALSAAPGPAAAEGERGRDHQHTFDAAAFDRVELDLHAADVRLGGAATDEVGLTLRELRVSDDCHIQIEAKGRTLVVETRNEARRGYCEVDVDLSLPASLVVDLAVGAGDVDLRTLLSEISISTGAGDVEGSVSGGHVSVETGAGDIRLSGLNAAVQASSGTGDVRLTFDRAPTGRIDASTGVGDVELRLPADTPVDAATSTGLGSVQQRLENQPGADTEVRASTGIGDIRLSES